MKLKKIHTVLKFKLSATWLKPYIYFNTDQMIKACKKVKVAFENLL